jgi:bacteriorhodopsin
VAISLNLPLPFSLIHSFGWLITLPLLMLDMGICAAAPTSEAMFANAMMFMFAVSSTLSTFLANNTAASWIFFGIGAASLSVPLLFVVDNSQWLTRARDVSVSTMYLFRETRTIFSILLLSRVAALAFFHMQPELQDDYVISAFALFDFILLLQRGWSLLVYARFVQRELDSREDELQHALLSPKSPALQPLAFPRALARAALRP